MAIEYKIQSNDVELDEPKGGFIDITIKAKGRSAYATYKAISNKLNTARLVLGKFDQGIGVRVDVGVSSTLLGCDEAEIMDRVIAHLEQLRDNPTPDAPGRSPS